MHGLPSSLEKAFGNISGVPRGIRTQSGFPKLAVRAIWASRS